MLLGYRERRDATLRLSQHRIMEPSLAYSVQSSSRIFVENKLIVTIMGILVGKRMAL